MKSKCATLLLATAVALSSTGAFAHGYKQTNHHSSKSMNSMNKMQGPSNTGTKSQSNTSQGGSANQKRTGSSTSGGAKY